MSERQCCDLAVCPDEANECHPEECLWFEIGDIAHLTMFRESTGETETIRAMWLKPRGGGAGWVLSDGTRIPARPRTVIRIDIVYPPDRTATEHVTHINPAEHTTQEESPQ